MPLFWLPINRTKVELKCYSILQALYPGRSINRTKVELK